MFELSAHINDFIIIVFSILVEGIPFVLIGSLLSGAMGMLISDQALMKVLPKSKFLQLLMMTMLGNVMPVCECGNVPFARRLVKKNLPPYLAVTFLLAAPVFNPIVITATLIAFSGNVWLLFYRLFFTLIIAVGAGYLFSWIPKDKILVKNFHGDECKDEHHEGHEHTHGCGASCGHDHSKVKQSKILGIFSIAKTEFIEMMGIFIFGAAVAAMIQQFVPKDFVFSFNSHEWLAIITMMALAFIISICSNVDAFFALAYSQIMPMSSVIAFLVFGPMFDIKAIFMMKTMFKWRALLLLVAFCALSTFLLSYLYFLFS